MIDDECGVVWCSIRYDYTMYDLFFLSVCLLGDGRWEMRDGVGR